MLKHIQLFFETHFSMTEQVQLPLEQQINIAAAALLIEMTVQDHEQDSAEIATVKSALVENLSLSQKEVDELYSLAEEEKKLATDYHQFTRLIADHYSQSEKIKLVESLWRVAYADNQLDKYEEHMVRRICDLIYVSHSDFIQAKHRVEAELSS